MATLKPLGILLGTIIPGALLLGDRPAAAAPPETAARARAISHVAWRLTDATVTSRGKAVTVRDGTLVTGYVIQSTATSIGDGRFRRGRFELTGTLFSPGSEPARPRRGTWHVNAAWAILDPHLSGDQKHQAPYAASGRLQAVLEFNPLEEPGMIDAVLFLTNVLPAGGRMVGQGTFSGNHRFEGMLSWKVLERCDPVAGNRLEPLNACVPGSRAERLEHQSALRLLRESTSARSGSSPVPDTSPAGTPH